MGNPLFILLALAPVWGDSGTLRGIGDAKHVSVWLSQELPAYRTAAEGFRSYLESRGYSVTLTFQALESKRPEPRAADLVFAIGSTAVHAAGDGSQPLPVIALTMKRSELQSQSPMTGVLLEFPAETEFAWIKRLFPKAKRVGVVYSPAENKTMIERASVTARSLGLELVARPVLSRDRLPDVLASLQNDVEVLWGVADTLVLTPETARSYLLFEFRHRIPFIGLSETWVKAGALSALGRDWADLGRQCGELAEQIFKGREAGALEPQSPRRILYYLNRNTAEVLRLALPAEAVRQAKDITP